MKEQIRGASITILLIVMTVLLALSLGAYGQDVEDIKFRHITIEDGLSHHEVSYVLQDAQGFMWFGTKYGLRAAEKINFPITLAPCFLTFVVQMLTYSNMLPFERLGEKA